MGGSGEGAIFGLTVGPSAVSSQLNDGEPRPAQGRVSSPAFPQQWPKQQQRHSRREPAPAFRPKLHTDSPSLEKQPLRATKVIFFYFALFFVALAATFLLKNWDDERKRADGGE